MLLLLLNQTMSLQLGPTLCDPMDCSPPPDSCIHGILQARRQRKEKVVSQSKMISRCSILKATTGKKAYLLAGIDSILVYLCVYVRVSLF